jgi:uncharacterized phage infection (PIP) family protein YhgE
MKGGLEAVAQKKEKETKILPVELTNEQIKERGEALAKVTKELDDTSAEAKQSAAGYREQLGGLHAEATRLAHVIESGVEDQDVEVKTEKDYDRGTIETVRIDTGEVLLTEQMTEEERQQQLAMN